MPGNEVEDEIHELFELDNSSLDQHLLQTGYENQQVLNYDQCVRKQRQVGESLNYKVNHYHLKKSDSIRCDGVDSVSLPLNQNCTLFTTTPGYSKSPSRNHQINSDGLLLRCQNSTPYLNQPHFVDVSNDQLSLKFGGSSFHKLHQETESCESPTLTVTSERSEVTEASTDFNFLQGQEQHLIRQQLGLPQGCPMQQSGYNDMQLLQQHIMLKQLQDLQRQQQFSQLGDVRQQSSLNPFSAITKHPGGLPLINGTPVQDAPQMLMHLMRGGASPTTPGIPNRFAFTQEQGQAHPSIGQISQHPDPSLYGSPIASARSDVSQYSQLHGISNDTVNYLTKAGNSAQKPVIESSVAFPRDQYIISPDHIHMPQGTLTSNQGYRRKDMFGSVDVQLFSSGTISGNFHAGNTAQINAVSKDISARQEQSGWSLVQQKTVQPGPPQGIVPLDPMEEKILYNMDENPWDASFHRHPASAAGSFSNIMENTDFSNSFPSIQNGSWSALMQSAVAEASSSDTGLQEEWSGLTFQNTERSTDNQLSNFVDGDKQQNSWADTNMQTASSFSSKPMPMFSASGMSSSFPAFQRQGNQFSTEHRENHLQDGSSGPLESKSPKASADWVGRSTQNRTASNDDAGKAYDAPTGNISESRYKGRDPDGCSWKTDENYCISYSRFDGVEQVRSEEDNNLVNREGFQKIHNQSTIEQMHGNNNQSNYMEHAGFSMSDGNDTSARKQHQVGSVLHDSAKPFGGEGETYGNQQKSGQMQISNARGMSVHDQGHSVRGNVVLEDYPYRDDHNFVDPDGSNITSQTSQNILELLHKVDHSREEGTTAHSSSMDSNTLTQSAAAEAHRSTASIYKQSSPSQGFSLRLAPPSQGLANPNIFVSSQGLPQVMSYLNPRTVNSELLDMNQTWIAMPSHGVQLDGNRMMLGQSGGPLYFNTQGNSIAALTSSKSPLGNQPHNQQVSTLPVVSQASHAMLHSAVSRGPPFNLTISQDNLPDASISLYNQQFPILEAVPLSQPSVMPSMSHLGELSAIQNAWSSVPNHQNLSGVEAQNKPSTLPSSMDLLHRESGLKSGKERSLPESASEWTSQPASLSQGDDSSQKCTSDENALPCVSQAPHSQQDGLDAKDNRALTFSGRNSSPATSSSLSITALQRNHTLPHLVQAMNNAVADPSMSYHRTEGAASPTGQQFNEHSITSRILVDNEPNSVSGGGATGMRSFLRGSGEDPSAKAFSQPILQNIASHEIDRFGQNVSQSQSSNSNLVAPFVSRGQSDLHMAPNWFKQYGTFRNGQMLSVSDSRISKPPTGQLPFWKPPQNLHIPASVEQVSAIDSSQAGSMKLSTATPLPMSPQFSAPYVMPDVNIQSIPIATSKKRKSMTSDLWPWHKEVTQGLQRGQNISIREQEWAQATNRLYEKVANEVEPLEDAQQLHRSKRRLILATQLMQLLVHPAPQSILFSNASLHYESLLFFVSRLTLGDACSLTHGLRSCWQSPLGNNKISEKLRTTDSTGDQRFSELMEEFTDRAKKLETDFRRLDGTASVVDVRVECQELERFAVINRFAKFHIRGQTHTDTSAGASSSGTQKPLPQRYVTAFPLPRNLPEGAQCLSL